MKNNYRRLKLLALLIILIASCFLAIRARAGNSSTFLALIYPQQEITGKVTDEEGNPLSGVTVFIKGDNKGTITDLSGSYSIKAGAGDILVFSYIGYKSREVPVGKHSHIDVKLESATTSLNAVKINAGYYSTTERESTGNISRVKGKEIEMQPVVSPLQALQGRMAGVEVISGGSHPGMASTIRIRGQNSLRTEGNYPLYIIDGVPVNSVPVESNSLLGSSGIDPLNNLNLSNIKSIEVLKDADATAIYGSRGANGVVLITTKNGYKSGTGLELSFYKGVATVPNRLSLLNTEQYLQVRKKAFENDGVEPTESNAYDLLLWDQERYTDWQDFVYGGKAETTKANISFSGGSENTSFRVGGSYFTQGTIYPGDYNYRKVTGDVNLNHRSEDQKFNLNFSANYGLDYNDLVGNIDFVNAALLPPNAPAVFNPDGSLNWEDWAIAGLDNPLKGFFNRSHTETSSLISNMSLSYEIFHGLRLKSSFGYTSYASRELWKLPARSNSPAGEQTNNSYHLNSNRISWIIEPQVNYETNFGKLNMDALVGATFQENTSEQLSLQGSGYSSEILIGNLAAADNVLNAQSPSTQYRYSALFSRIGMNWDKKYFLNFTGRRDGSSRFGANNRFSNFGAIGAAWIFSEETFMKNSIPLISFGKLRGSYGITGNDQIGDYGYMDAYEATKGPGGLYPTALSNPDFSWEKNKKLEAGLELGLFNDRMHLGTSWYRNRSSNQLVGYSLPYITGFGSVQANLPATVENTGWEIEAQFLNIQQENFRWETSLNISFPKNQLLNYPNIDQSSYANTYRVGYPLNISLYYEYTGLDPETGFYTIRDVNQDGRYDYQDQVVIQNNDRKYFGGINNSLTYKNLNLQFLWEFAKQKGGFYLFNAGRPLNSVDAILTDDKYQRISQSSQADNAYYYVINTDFPIEDASYLRLKTLSLNYGLPDVILSKIGAEGGKIFLQGQNLLTLSSFEGLDPEMNYAHSSLGNLRTITGGLQLNF